MNISYRIVAYLLPSLLVGLLACQPTEVTPTDPENPGEIVGVPTAIGQPVGAPMVKTISPAGGTITSPDGKMSFTFPAGAVAKETVVTIQPVENQAFSGNGLAYSISASDTKLTKNAEMTLHYGAEDLEGTTPEALGIAYQDANGIWQGRSAGLKVDKANQTVSAPVTHLAHWSFYEQFHLSIANVKTGKPGNVLAPAESAELTAFYQETSSDNPLAPLTPAKIISASRVVRWTLNGNKAGGTVEGTYANEGQIRDDRSLAKATYDAPPREPDTNPVAVGVEIDLKEKGHLILVKHITIQSPSYLTVNGAKDANPNVLLTVNNGTLQGAITDQTGLMMISFVIPSFHGKGSYTFAPKGADQIIARSSAVVSGGHGYYDESAVWHSGNVVLTITEYGGKGKPMSGTIGGTFYYGTSPFGGSAKFIGVPVVL